MSLRHARSAVTPIQRKASAPEAGHGRAVQLKHKLAGLDFEAQAQALAPPENAAMTTPVQMKPAAQTTVQMKGAPVQMEEGDWLDNLTSAASSAVESASEYLGGGGSSTPSTASAPATQEAPPAAQGAQTEGGGGEQSWWDRATETASGVVAGIGEQAGAAWDRAKETVSGIAQGAGELVGGEQSGAAAQNGIFSSLFGENEDVDYWETKIFALASKLDNKVGKVFKIASDVRGVAGSIEGISTVAENQSRKQKIVQSAGQLAAAGESISSIGSNFANFSGDGKREKLAVFKQSGEVAKRAKEVIGKLELAIDALEFLSNVSSGPRMAKFDDYDKCKAWAVKVGDTFSGAKSLVAAIPGGASFADLFDAPKAAIGAFAAMVERRYQWIDKETRDGPY